MGRVRARFKNVLITGVILSSTLFFWVLTVSKQGKINYLFYLTVVIYLSSQLSTFYTPCK